MDMDFVEYGQKYRLKIIKSLVTDKENIIIELGANFSNYIIKESVKLDIKKNCDIQANLSFGIPLATNSVDTVIACEIIEHLLSPYMFIKEIKRILKPGGVLIFSTPNICSLKNRAMLFLGMFPNNAAQADFYRYWTDDKDIPKIAHFSDYNFPILIVVLEKEGFEILEKKTNGIFLKGKLIFPLSFTPAVFGEHVIIKAKKK